MQELIAKKLMDGISDAVEIAGKYAGFDGAHHKQWVIDQMIRCLLGSSYDDWVQGYNSCTDEDGAGYEEWGEGIAP